MVGAAIEDCPSGPAEYSILSMPSRPSKKVKTQPAPKPGAQNADGAAQDSQQRHRNHNTKTILGRFQGRKSIDRG